MLLKQSFILLMTAYLTACSTNFVEAPDSEAKRQARLQLIEAAHEVRQSAMGLKAFKEKHAPYKQPYWVNSKILDSNITVDWKGPLMALLEEVNNQADLVIFTKGTAPEAPIFVDVGATNRRVGDVLADIDMQIYPTARLIVNTAYRTIEVRYAH